MTNHTLNQANTLLKLAKYTQDQLIGSIFRALSIIKPLLYIIVILQIIVMIKLMFLPILMTT